MLKTIIIDDEDHVREILKKFIRKYCPQIKVVGEAGSFAEASELLNKNTPDLLLLDVHLGDGNGFDLLKKYESPDFKVIFITAHNQYAVQAFKVSAVDFILKPVNPLELTEAVARAQDAVASELRLKLEALETNLANDQNHRKKLVVKTLENIYLLPLGNITHCESDGAYTLIHTNDQGRILSSKPIKEYDEMLSNSGFYRCQRSYLINLSHIKRFEKAEGGYLILSDNHKVPVSSRKKEYLLELFDEINQE